MIEEAIQKLDEPEGSTMESISNYIKANFSGLPSGHDRLLPYYLRKLIDNDMAEFVMGPNGCYHMAQAQDQAQDGGHNSPGDVAEAKEDGHENNMDVAETPLCERKEMDDDDDGAKRVIVDSSEDAAIQSLMIVSPEKEVNNDNEGMNANIEDNATTTTQKQNCEDVLMNNRNNDEIFVDPLQPQSVSPYDDDGATVNVAPDKPSEGESKGAETDEVVASLDATDHYDNVAQETEPLHECPIDGSNNNKMDVAGPLELPSASINVDGDAIEHTLHHVAANVDDDSPMKELTLSQSFEDGLVNPKNEEDSAQKQNLWVEFKRMNPNLSATELMQNMAVPNLNATKLVQNIALVMPSEGETEGAENVEPTSVANLDEREEGEDDEGVPLSCEGDRVMDRMPLPPTYSELMSKRWGRPPKRRCKRDSTGNIVIEVQDGAKVVQTKILPQRRERPPRRKCTELTQLVDPSTLIITSNGVETRVSDENQVTWSTLTPKRRGRPPKRNPEFMDLSEATVVQAGDVEPIELEMTLTQRKQRAQKLVPVRREMPQRCPETTQLVDPSTLVINSNVIKAKVCNENQVTGSTPTPKRRGRPPKRNPIMDNPEAVVDQAGDIEPNPSLLGTNGNVKPPMAEESSDGSKISNKRRGGPPKRENEGDVEPLQLVVPSSLGANSNAKFLNPRNATRNTDDGSEPVCKRGDKLPKKRSDGDTEPLQSADDNAKLVLSRKVKRSKDDRSEQMPKRLGRPPKRNKEPTDGSSDAIAQDGEAKLTKGGRKSKKSYNQESGGDHLSMDPKDNSEMPHEQKESNLVLERRGRPRKVPKRRG